MDEKLQEAYAALQAAHDAGNTADATQLADYITALQSQQQTTSAAEPSSEVRTGAALPAIGGALGATVGTAAAVGSKGKNILHALDKLGTTPPPSSTGYNPRGSSVEESVQNWRTYADAQNEAAKSVRRDSELHKKYPGFTRPNLPHLQPVVPTTGQTILGHAANIGTNKPIAGLTAGANALDFAQQIRAGNPVQSTVSGLGLLGSAAPYIKRLPKSLRGAGMAVSAAAPIVNRLLDKLTNPPEEEQKAAGGVIQHYDVGSSVKAGASQVKKYSDIIQHHIGKMLHPTIVDTTKLDLAAGKMAGNEASNLQNISAPHKAEDWVFANDSMSAAKRLWNVNQRNDGNVVFTGLIGSPYQLKTNRSVFGDLEDEFYKAVAAGKLDPDLLKRYQTALENSTHKSQNEMVKTFPNQFDIRDRDAFKENSKLFHQRGALADIIGGSGPTGVPLGGKKGQIFDWEGVLNASRDPKTIGAPSQSIGTRLFTLNDRPPEYRPDLHNAFDYSLFGKDLKESFNPVNKEVGIPTALETIRQNNIAQGKKPDVTSMHIARNILMQPITEQYVKDVQAAGFAEGGEVQHFQAGKRVLSSGLEALLNSIKAEGRTPVVPVPNRWFAQPDKFPQVQGLVNKTLENSQLPREAFHSGAFIDPRTGQILDKNIYNDVGVLIDPNTGRPMMSAGKESGIDILDPKTGSYTKSNLVRQSLFKPTGGDPMLGDMPFIATIEKGGMGHKYGLGTEYATPTEMHNTMTGANPTLRPRSRGDVFGMGDVVGQVQVGGRGDPHDVYEKLFVAPKGSDVPGVKLNKKRGGKVKKVK